MPSGWGRRHAPPRCLCSDGFGAIHRPQPVQQRTGIDAAVERSPGRRPAPDAVADVLEKGEHRIDNARLRFGLIGFFLSEHMLKGETYHRLRRVDEIFPACGVLSTSSSGSSPEGSVITRMSALSRPRNPPGREGQRRPPSSGPGSVVPSPGPAGFHGRPPHRDRGRGCSGVRRCNCERWASLSAVPWVLRTFLKPAWWGIITSM